MSISAKYPGVCARTWRSYGAGARLVKMELDWAIDDDVRLPIDATIVAYRGDGENFVIGESFRHQGGGIITAVASRSQYFREDGFSFGVGAESGYLHKALCRPASQEESEKVVASEREREMRRKSDNSYEALFNKLSGELVPPQRNRPQGELVKINGGHNIMGHGTEVLIEEGEAYIWVLEDNSANGHCWAASNISAPGCAGEIGYRFEATPERIAWARDYQECYEEYDARRAEKMRILSY